MEWVRAHEQEITRYAYARMSEVEGLRILGPGPGARGRPWSPSRWKGNTHDIAAARPLWRRSACGPSLRGAAALAATASRPSARASFYLYNTLAEVDVLVDALHKTQEVFAL